MRPIWLTLNGDSRPVQFKHAISQLQAQIKYGFCSLRRLPLASDLSGCTGIGLATASQMGIATDLLKLEMDRAGIGRVIRGTLSEFFEISAQSQRQPGFVAEYRGKHCAGWIHDPFNGVG